MGFLYEYILVMQSSEKKISGKNLIVNQIDDLIGIE